MKSMGLVLFLSILASVSSEVNYLNLYEFETTTTNPSGNDYENSFSTPSPPKPFLLPSALKPLSYNLEIVSLLEEDVPDITDSNFLIHNVSRFDALGKVIIELVCLEGTDNITLHAHQDINIDTLKIKILLNKPEGSTSLEIRNVTRENETDFLIIHLFEQLPEQGVDSISVDIPFVTKVASDRLNGLYLDYYVDPKTNETRYLSTTLFAPNHARKAFPCFDEPRFKAKFKIRIGRKIGGQYSTISNMPLISKGENEIDFLPGYVWDTFQESPPLPTYIVAFITSEFATRTVKSDDVEIRLHAPEYLLERTVKLNLTDHVRHNNLRNPYLLHDPLLFIEDTLRVFKSYGMQYPLPELDIIALPHFFFSAMENIGAITFKYPVILNIENVTTVNELLKLNFVAGHELAHQVFGNMLTPSAWSYVWLKESFSDYFGQKLLSDVMHGSTVDEDFFNKELQIAMRYDQGSDTHPLENTIKSASDVGEIYTDIPYRKGASIVRMTEKILTDAVFMEGLKSLFLENKFGNIDQDELFKHLEIAQRKHGILEGQGLSPNITVKDVLELYTKQCGYPVVEVWRENGNLRLKQNFYLNSIYQSLFPDGNGTVDENENTNSTSKFKLKCFNNESNLIPEQYWWIPITLTKLNDFLNDSLLWIPPNGDEICLDHGVGYRVSNKNGYFRILYSQEELTSILNKFRDKYINENYVPNGIRRHHYQVPEILSPSERSQLLDDYFAFAFHLRLRETVTQDLFRMIHTIMPFETEQVVWNTFFANMDLPYKLFQKTKHFPSLKKFVISLLKPLSPFLEWKLRMTYSSACTDSAVLARQMKLTQFKSLVLQWECRLDMEECIERATPKVMEFIQSPNSKFPAEESSLFCAAVKSARETELDELWNAFEKLYFNEHYSVQRDRYLKALSCARNTTYLKRLLSWSCNETLDFHDVDRVTLIKSVIANPLGRDLILDFLSDNFKVLYKSASVANPVTEAIKALADYANSQENLAAIDKFIEKHMEAMEKKKKFLEKMKRKAKLNLSWFNKMSNELFMNFEHYAHHVLWKSPNTCAQ